jgi:hypothetical protein
MAPYPLPDGVYHGIFRPQFYEKSADNAYAEFVTAVLVFSGHLAAQAPRAGVVEEHVGQLAPGSLQLHTVSDIPRR